MFERIEPNLDLLTGFKNQIEKSRMVLKMVNLYKDFTLVNS